MTELDSALGSLLVASWLDAMLLMLEIVQVVYYFVHYRHDAWRYKALVASLLMLDLVSEAAHNILIYLYAVTHWGDSSFVQYQHWPTALFLPTAGLSALIVQMFLIHRLWRLSGRLFVPILLAVLSLTSFASLLGIAVISLQYPALVGRSRVAPVSILWLIAGLAADSGIALSLVWQFHKVQTPYDRTRGLIHRLTTIAVSTGIIPTVFALVSLVTGATLASKGSGLPIAAGFLLARSYSITLLWNLNIRGRLSNNTSGSSTGPHSEEFEFRQRSARPVRPDSMPVQMMIHREVDVTVHDDFKPAPALGSKADHDHPPQASSLSFAV